MQPISIESLEPGSELTKNSQGISTLGRKNLCVFITDYGKDNKIYLDKILHNFNLFLNYKITIVLFSTEYTDNHTYKNLNINNLLFPTNIGRALAYQHRLFLKHEFIHLEEEYDIFIGMENDIFIEEKTIDYFYKQTSFMDSLVFSIGTLRYENKHNEKYYIDTGLIDGRNASKVFEYVFTINGDRFYQTLLNPHSGCWIFTKEQLRSLLQRGINDTPINDLENSITGFYKSPWPGSPNGIQKIIPLSAINNTIVHHMPDKYMNCAKWEYPHKVLTHSDLESFDITQLNRIMSDSFAPLSIGSEPPI